MNHSIFVAIAAAVMLAQSACAQEESEAREVVYAGITYSTTSETAEVREFLGRPSLFVDRAFVERPDVSFGNGVIEYDVAAAVPSGFVGINFRSIDESNFEQFYVRFHQSDRPDSTQYMSAINGLGAWQIHAGPNDATAVVLPTNEWVHTKIVVDGDKADIFVTDMETPLLHIADLRLVFGEGPISLYASDRPGMVSGAYFSNITVRDLEPGEGVIGTPREEPALPNGLITTWSVSEPFDEALMATAENLDHMDLGQMAWSSLEVEGNGIANLARLAGPAQGADTVIARMTLDAEEARVQMVRFGYSDRVRVFVNGELQFYGNSLWRSRDHRFLGTINWEDQIAAHLEPGENEIIFAVSESFGGWGVTAAVVPAE